MTVYMLVLLAAIALIVVFIGLFLTSRTASQTQGQLRSRRAASTVSLDLERRQRRTDAVAPYTYGARRYASSYVEPVGWSWSNFWQLFAVNRLVKRRAGDPTPWLGIVLIMLVCFWMGLLLLHTIAPNETLAAIVWGSTTTHASSTNTQNGPSPTYHASQNLIRISQLDPAQYSSQQSYNLWAYSACSSAAMTEVINAYGNHYRIADILKVEAQIGEITPQQGLLEDRGVARTVAYFGFKTSWGYNLSLNQVIATANSGRPVIVSWPPSRYDGGHLVVVTGGNSSTVYLADSSIYDRHSLSRSQFMKWWGGFSAVVTPS